jgi:hypothetical protein
MSNVLQKNAVECPNFVPNDIFAVGNVIVIDMRRVDASFSSLETALMNCRTVEDCDERLSCINDVRLIAASKASSISSSTIALIDDLETRLWHMRAIYWGV